MLELTDILSGNNLARRDEQRAHFALERCIVEEHIVRRNTDWIETFFLGRDDDIDAFDIVHPRKIIDERNDEVHIGSAIGIDTLVDVVGQVRRCV